MLSLGQRVSSQSARQVQVPSASAPNGRLPMGRHPVERHLSGGRRSCHSMIASPNAASCQCHILIAVASAGSILLACSTAAGDSAVGSSKCAAYLHCRASQHQWSSMSQSDQRTAAGSGSAHTIFSDFHAGFPSGQRPHAAHPGQKLISQQSTGRPP